MSSTWTQSQSKYDVTLCKQRKSSSTTSTNILLGQKMNGVMIQQNVIDALVIMITKNSCWFSIVLCNRSFAPSSLKSVNSIKKLFSWLCLVIKGSLKSIFWRLLNVYKPKEEITKLLIIYCISKNYQWHPWSKLSFSCLIERGPLKGLLKSITNLEIGWLHFKLIIMKLLL